MEDGPSVRGGANHKLVEDGRAGIAVCPASLGRAVRAAWVPAGRRGRVLLLVGMLILMLLELVLLVLLVLLLML